MWTPSRRTLLGRLLAALPALPALRNLPGAQAVRQGDQDGLDPNLLSALAEVVLPANELGPDGLERAVGEFRSWSSGFGPEAELDHPYLWSDELRFGPRDPRPGWREQIELYDRTANEKHGSDFAELELAARRSLVESRLAGRVPESLGHAGETEEVALALMAWFLATPWANDLCYRAEIGRHECRGLPTVGEEPPPLVQPEPLGEEAP